jgi:spermatogenesis-associated protein 2
MMDNELISFGSESTMRSKATEPKLRSSLKKSTQSTSDSLEMEPDLNELRALKGVKSGDMKARDGIGSYQTWDYVFQNLEKETSTKNLVGNHDDKVAAELQLENLKITSNGHGPPKLHQKSNGVPHRMSETSMRSSSGNHTASVQTKTRTKSVSTGTEVSNHEHKRTSSVALDTSSRSNSNSNKYKPPQQPQIVVPPGEWSCRFCTFLNPDVKKICDMCSKSKDFFLDADKNPATATCV